MAKIDLTRQAKAPQTTGKQFLRTTAVTSSLTGEYEWEAADFNFTGSFTGSFSGSFKPTRIVGLGIVSSSAQVIPLLPSGIVSSSRQIREEITGSFRAMSASIETRLRDAEIELGRTLLSGSAQIEALLPANTITSSQQITDLGFISSNQSLTFSSDTNALTISNGNSVDLTPLAGGGGGGGGGGTAITASDEGTALSQNLRTLDFTGNAVSASGVGNKVTIDINAVTQSGNLVDLSGVKIQYSNVYSTLGDLPSATDYHGMFAHVHATGKAYFAHAGNWVELVNASNNISSSAQVQSIITDAYISASAAGSGFGSGGGGGTSDYESLSNVPAGIVSSSRQIQDEISGSFTAMSSSLSTRVSAAEVELARTLLSGSAQVKTLLPSGTVSSSIQIGSEISGAFANTSASIASELTFNGNRRISNPDLGDLFSNNFNAGTSGSISEFLQKVFFLNTSPQISSSRLTINEFETTGSLVGTITATDAENPVLFTTHSLYSADAFQIHSGSGQIRVKGHTTSSLNTVNRGDGQFAHPFVVSVSDTFVTASATIFIRVTPNTAPVFRAGSVGGSEILSQTGSVAESTTNGTQVLQFFVTDTEEDTITISPLSQSSNLFSMATASVAGGQRITITTATSSFDYESAEEHFLFVSASDQHHGNTSGSYLTTLPIRVNVTDNQAPTMAAQSFNIQEELSSYADNGLGSSTNIVRTVGSISTNDSEGDTVTFTALTLTSGSGKGNTSQTDVANDPFQVTSAGVLQLKAGQYLNAGVFNQYKYDASYKDNFNAASSSGTITVNVLHEGVPSLTTNGTFYIIESAQNGDLVRTNTNGRTGTQADFNSGATVAFSVSSSGFFAINSAGNLSLAAHVSGTAFTFDAGNPITGEVTASTAFGTQNSASLSVNVAKNNGPTPSFSNTSANLNTNGARPGNTLSTISFSDTEGDSLNHNSFIFTDPSGQLSATKSGDTYIVKATTNLSGSTTYQMTASIEDTHGFRAGVKKHTFTIAQAPIGSMTANGTFYIIESGVSGNQIRLNTNGRSGTQGDLGVTYSPQYNSAAVAAFTSSNAMISVNNSGNLTLSQNVSGSAFTFDAGNTIDSTITFQDQFGNIGSGSISVNVAKNNAPDITFTPSSPDLDTTEATSGSNLVTLTFSDTEGDTVDTTSFSFTTGSHAELDSASNGSGGFFIRPKSNLQAGTFEVTASIKDEHGFRTNTESVTITVTQGASKFYFYKSERGVLGLNGTDSQAINILGDAGADGIAITADSPIDKFQSGSISSNTIAVTGGNVILVASSSATTLASSGSGHSAVRQIGNVNLSGNSGNGHQYIILFPSSSAFAGKPNTLTNSLGGSTAGEYVVWNDNAASDSVDSAGVYYFQLKTGTSTDGFNRWGMIYGLSPNTAATQYYHVIPSSGSGPSSEV